MAGSKPGGVVAAAWAIMQHLGEEGYMRLNREMLRLTRKLQAGIEAIPGFHVMGKPAMYVFAFTAENSDLTAVAAEMTRRGWFILRQTTSPESLQLLLTPVHLKSADALLRDLRDAAGASPQATEDVRVAAYAN